MQKFKNSYDRGKFKLIFQLTEQRVTLAVLRRRLASAHVFQLNVRKLDDADLNSPLSRQRRNGRHLYLCSDFNVLNNVEVF